MYLLSKGLKNENIIPDLSDARIYTDRHWLDPLVDEGGRHI